MQRIQCLSSEVESAFDGDPDVVQSAVIGRALRIVERAIVLLIDDTLQSTSSNWICPPLSESIHTFTLHQSTACHAVGEGAVNGVASSQKFHVFDPCCLPHQVCASDAPPTKVPAPGCS